jgi:glycosyltransferase involved in cell wall biosynthesis
MPNNLVSIIIPTFNRAYLINETLNSIITQTHTNWECIIVDDGSTDNTAEIIKSFIQKDKRFKYYLRPSNRIKGANACRNYGFELSKGDYVKWFDSDDIMHPEFLQKQIELLYNNADLNFCASFSETFIDKINNVVAYNNPAVYVDNQDSLFNYITGKIIFLTPSPLWKRNFLIGKKLFDENLHNAHETDFNFARLIEGAKFQYLDEVLFFVRRGHQSIDGNLDQDINGYLSMFKYYQKVFGYLKKESDFLNNKQRKELSRFILYKQLMIINNVRRIGSIKSFPSEINKLVFNTLQIHLKLINRIKILFGIFLLVFFKKGYRFFDLDELKTAKYYR